MAPNFSVGRAAGRHNGLPAVTTGRVVMKTTIDLFEWKTTDKNSNYSGHLRVRWHFPVISGEIVDIVLYASNEYRY